MTSSNVKESSNNNNNNKKPNHAKLNQQKKHVDTAMLHVMASGQDWIFLEMVEMLGDLSIRPVQREDFEGSNKKHRIHKNRQKIKLFVTRDPENTQMI